MEDKEKKNLCEDCRHADKCPRCVKGLSFAKTTICVFHDWDTVNFTSEAK